MAKGKKRLKARLADRVRRVTRKNRHPETDWGPPVGREAWIKEAERRLDEVRSGAVKTKSAESVFRKARAKLR